MKTQVNFMPLAGNVECKMCHSKIVFDSALRVYCGLSCKEQYKALTTRAGNIIKTYKRYGFGAYQKDGIVTITLPAHLQEFFSWGERTKIWFPVVSLHSDSIHYPFSPHGSDLNYTLDLWREMYGIHTSYAVSYLINSNLHIHISYANEDTMKVQQIRLIANYIEAISNQSKHTWHVVSQCWDCKKWKVGSFNLEELEDNTHVRVCNLCFMIEGSDIPF